MRRKNIASVLTDVKPSMISCCHQKHATLLRPLIIQDSLTGEQGPSVLLQTHQRIPGSAPQQHAARQHTVVESKLSFPKNKVTNSYFPTRLFTFSSVPESITHSYELFSSSFVLSCKHMKPFQTGDSKIAILEAWTHPAHICAHLQRGSSSLLCW